MVSCAWLFFLSAATAGQPPEAPASSEPSFIAGQLSRLDLVEGAVWLRPDGRATELRMRVDPQQTRISRSGRLLRFEDIQPGERAIAAYALEAPAHPRVLVLKLGHSRYAIQ